ncbi:MAG: TonB-dependent receptor [Bacteroidia bacterium]|nr:TonB-dependent receptor [Bacteroidia bacterium]
MYLKFFICFVSSLLMSWPGVYGQTATGDTAKYHLSDVVITGQHAPLAANRSTFRIQVIDRKRIEAQAANTLDDLMRSELNTLLNLDPVLGSVMQLQGVSGENVKILIDGVPVVGRLGGELDLSQLPLNRVERIEIVEGPMSVEYGTNALAGVINLITKKSIQSDWYLNLNAYEATAGSGVSLYEGFHNYSGDFFLKKGNHQMSLGGGRNFFGGNIEDAGKRPPAWNPKRQVFGSGTYGWEKKNFRLNLTSDYFDELLILKGAISGTYRPYALDENYQTIRANIKAHGDWKISKKSSFSALAAFSDYIRNKTVIRKDMASLDTAEILAQAGQDGFQAIMSRGTFSHLFEGGKISLQTGYDLNLETATGGKILSGSRDIEDYAVFSSVEYQPLEGLVFRPGLRFAHNSLYPAPVAPSFHAKYALTPAWTLRGSYARGFRAPSLRELYFEFIDVNHNITGNPDLRAEYSHNFQLSANGQKLKGETLLKAEISTFYNAIRDKIELAFTGASDVSLSYFNLEALNTAGGQVLLSAQKGGLKLEAGTALLGRQIYIANLSVIPPLNFSSNTTFRFSWLIPRLKTTLSGFYKYNGPVQGFRNLGNEESPELITTRISGYHIADLTLERSWWKKRISTSLGVKNLFNVTNVASTASGGAHSGGGGAAIALGRNFFLRLNLKLEK